MNIKERIDELSQELIVIRRELHQHPELGFEEYQTNAIISRCLTAWGIEFESGIAKTGIVGIIRGQQKDNNSTVALRADIDALPIHEENAVEYKSKTAGVMHACGHDVHAAILLGAAKILSELSGHFNGNVKLFFQPAEETTGGALPMINEGCMNDPTVDYVLGLHVMPYLEAGKVELKYSKLNAASDNIKIVIQGKSGHGAYPESGIDAILIASHTVIALQSLVSRNTSPLNSVVLSLGTIEGGARGNIIADKVELRGTLRTLDPQTRHYAKERIASIVSQQAASFGGIGHVEFAEGYESLINDNELVDVLKATAVAALGSEQIVFKELPSLGVEDFSYFSNRAKGAFYHLGCGNVEKGITASLHNPGFDVDESCIKTGVLMQVLSTLKLLGSSIELERGN